MEQPAAGTGNPRPPAGEDRSMELGTCQELLHRLRELEVCGRRQGRAWGVRAAHLRAQYGESLPGGRGLGVSLLKLPWGGLVPLLCPAQAAAKGV